MALYINPGWFTSTKAKNLWNPGPWMQKFYGGESLQGALAIPTGLLMNWVLRC